MGKRRHRSGASEKESRQKVNGEGEYPPPHQLESEAFESYYREAGVVPAGEFDEFLASLKQPLGVSFRITGHPSDPAAVSLRNYMEHTHLSRLSGLVMDDQVLPSPTPIGWYPGRMAWRFDVSRSILRGKRALKNEESPAARTLAAFHSFLMTETELGTISRQEEVSMVPPCLLDVQPGHIVADLCAAPGSKTQQLVEAINPPLAGASSAPSRGPRGIVLANDMDYRRCHLLVHQAKRLHSPALIVTNHDATMLPTKMSESLAGVSAGLERSLRFDRMLCDVPCSGDGTLRKAPDLWRRWSDGMGIGLHRMQLNILLRALALLRPGGRLVYSTCSMNPIEDEVCDRSRREGPCVRQQRATAAQQRAAAAAASSAPPQAPPQAPPSAAPPLSRVAACPPARRSRTRSRRPAKPNHTRVLSSAPHLGSPCGGAGRRGGRSAQ